MTAQELVTHIKALMSSDDRRNADVYFSDPGGLRLVRHIRTDDDGDVILSAEARS